jgi:peptidoglycan-associated lipoprotein
MNNDYRAIALCLMMFIAVAFAGCSSETAKPAPSAAAASPAQESKEKLGSAPKSSTSDSSLDALKRGESSATPASSPLKDVYFDFDSYDIRADARDVLKANGGWLKANAAGQVEIEGHCDERGTTEYNMALGAKRAQSAKDYLVTLGVPADRLTTISYGQELPVCKEHSEDCWQKNRRARFVIQAARPTS